MQRLVSRLGVPVGAAAAAGAHSVRAQQPQHGPGSQHATEPTGRLAMEEQEGFVHIGLQAQPVQQHEVSHAITQLAALGGVPVEQHQQRRPAAPAPLPSMGPLIEEIDAESDASSEGSAANLLMASAEYGPFSHAVAAVADEAQPSDLDLLSSTITNMLNNPQVMGAIQGQLMQDPAFVQLVNRHSPELALPAPARVLFLEDITAPSRAWSEDGEPAGDPDGGNPLVGLLMGIQRGVAAVAVHIGEAFCHLGHLVRGLGEHLRTALTGMDAHDGAGAASAGDPGHDRGADVQRAVFKVACVVAVMVVTRRVVALPAMAV